MKRPALLYVFFHHNNTAHIQSSNQASIFYFFFLYYFFAENRLCKFTELVFLLYFYLIGLLDYLNTMCVCLKINIQNSI